MTSPKSDLVVLAGAGDELAGWIGVLQDWSALGLVRDFIAIPLDESPAQTFAGVRVSSGRSTPIRLQDELAARVATTSVYVACLGTVATEARLADATGSAVLKDEVHHVLPGVPLIWAQVVAVGTSTPWPVVEPDAFAWTGAHNIVIAPENAQTPASGKAPVEAADLTQPVGLTHRAAALATIVGLWVSQKTPSIRGVSIGGGNRVMAFRSFSRHVMTANVDARLLSRVIDVEGRYPVPRDPSGRELQRSSDESRAAQRMADAVIAAHRDKLEPGERVSIAGGSHQLSFGEAVRRFLRFIGAALRFAPRTFVEAMQAESARRVAPFAQRTVYGPDSSHEIMLRGIAGVDADRRLATAQSVESDLDALVAMASDGQQGSAGARYDAADLWKDFTSAARTLLDGETRRGDLAAATESSVTVVVTNSSIVAPDPRAVLTLPAVARRFTTEGTLSVVDFDRHQLVDGLCGDHAEVDSKRSDEVGEFRKALADWEAPARASYVGRVGTHIAGNLAKLRLEASGFQRELGRSLGDGTLPEDVQRAQRTLGNLLWIVFIALSVTSAGLVFCGSEEWISWSRCATVILLLWMAGIVGMYLVFLRRQQRFFQLLHQREHAVRHADAVAQNLAASLSDLRRLLALNRQYVDWATALGTFVKAPWGRVTRTDDREVELGIGFGFSHRFGRIVADEDVTNTLARRVQRDLFGPGWLGEAWDAFLTDLPEFEDKLLVQDDPQLLFTDTRMRDRSVLSLWSSAVAQRERFDVAEPVRRRLAEMVDGMPTESGQKVSWTDGTGMAHHSTYDEFVAGVRDVPEASALEQSAREFSRRLFANVTETSEPWVVATSELLNVSNVGELFLVAQCTAPFNARDLAFCQPLPVEAATPVVSPDHDLPQV